MRRWRRPWLLHLALELVHPAGQLPYAAVVVRRGRALREVAQPRPAADGGGALGDPTVA